MTELGKQARDRVTGFQGTVTARCEYLYGVPRVEITSPELDGGKPVAQWFEEARVEVETTGHAD